MDIDLTRTFLEIVRHGSFVAAAERMHITQTAVTARVQKLEAHLNSTLFVRNRAGARLTPDGEAFVTYANQILQTWEAAERDLPLPAGIHNVLHVGGGASNQPVAISPWLTSPPLRSSTSQANARISIDSQNGSSTNSSISCRPRGVAKRQR